MDKELYNLLVKETPLEAKQKRTAGFIPDVPDIETYDSSLTPILKDQFFFKNKNVYISKHNRFALYPEHSHQFLEFNYQLKGTSHQIINGTPYVLQEGDILLMDTGSRHSIEALGENDILLNILFSDKMISLNWLEQMHVNDSILYRVLLTADPNRQSARNFLIFHTHREPHLQNILYWMIKEYFFPNTLSNKIVSHYLPILLYELARQYPVEKELKEYQEEHSPFIQTLRLIDTEYRTITLAEVAKRLNFNKNYLSNLIKQQSGQTFTELVTKKKLLKAQLLLQSTELPVNSVYSLVGFSNKTFFYKKYKEFFKKLPSEDRKLI